MGVIGFKKAKCKDCYKCVRLCPVKAITVQDEHAKFVANDCILCGQCLEACPQDAITVFSDIDKVKKYIEDGVTVIASLSPAYLGIYTDIEPGQFIEGLFRLGFSEIRESAEGAIYVTSEYERLMREGTMENIITSACPVINQFVENYYPDMIPYMAPVISPVIAHGKMLKEEFGDSVKIVSISPCLAESVEDLRDSRTSGYIDAVIDFEDLNRWFKEKNISLQDCRQWRHDRVNPKINGAYATSGGITMAIQAKGGAVAYGYQTLFVDGIDACREIFESIRKGEIRRCFIELNSCTRGCINGPVTGRSQRNRFKSHLTLLGRIMKDFPEYEPLPESISLARTFEERRKAAEMPDEDEIRKILIKIGKDSPEKELNCGACGFPTCRDKAIAVYQGRSQIQMCLPYMYENARYLSDVILSVTPSLIIIVDEQLRIREFNNAAEVKFNISREEALKSYLYEIIDSESFQEVIQEKRSHINLRVDYKSYNMKTIQNLIYVREQGVVIGIIRDITAEEEKNAKRYKLKMEAVASAQKVIDKQMMVAQEIAGLLGETTAETKMTLMKLRNRLLEDGEDAK